MERSSSGRNFAGSVDGDETPVYKLEPAFKDPCVDFARSSVATNGFRESRKRSFLSTTIPHAPLSVDCAKDRSALNAPVYDPVRYEFQLKASVARDTPNYPRSLVLKQAA
ncbi:MAG: hypothetical protein WAM69_04830 [Candidatus Sulfotelmatobacter sp.]